MKRKLPLILLLASSLAGCAAGKRWFGTPARTQAVVATCQDGLKDLEQIHTTLLNLVKDPKEAAELQRIHDTVKQALENCVAAGSAA